MHETSIAMSIVDTVLAEAKKQEAIKVISVNVEVGELTFLGVDQMEFWVKTNFDGTIAAEAEINFITVKAEIKCNSCAYTGQLVVKDDPAFHLKLPVFACPECGKSNIEIIRGRDAFIRNIEIERN